MHPHVAGISAILCLCLHGCCSDGVSVIEDADLGPFRERFRQCLANVEWARSEFGEPRTESTNKEGGRAAVEGDST